MRVKSHGSNQTIIEDKGCSVLYSYEIPVALIVSSGNRAYKTDRKWSVTTSKHINQWLRAEGFDPKEDVTLVPQDTLGQWQTSEFV
tara:strand:+ start:80 stop:337 length:258 start_codon:yes stop_codon:yes gene_type:complete